MKLAVSDEHRDALHRTAEQYLYCANRTSEFCWNDTSVTNCKTHKRRVRDALYTVLREETDLQAQLVQAAIRRGVEAVKGVVERWKNGQRVSRPTFTAETMDYDARSATFSRRKASLATVDVRTNHRVRPSDARGPITIIEWDISADESISNRDKIRHLSRPDFSGGPYSK